jgi:hypothetical protein
MRRRLSIVMALPILGVALAGCSGASFGAYDRVTGGGETWSVSVADPRFESLDSCSEDPSVAVALQSADLPSSSLGIQLVAGSTEDDAVRIADCLTTALVSGEISIISPVK